MQTASTDISEGGFGLLGKKVMNGHLDSAPGVAA